MSKEKHIVTINWLHQCWNEHRIVPMESHRVPPFYGLIICVTRIPADERKEMEKLIVQNGGKYSAELTKQCTHLICEVPEGDKFKVAQRWGNIRIVTRKWFDQSIAKRVCLSEDAYPVNTSSVSSVTALRGKLMVKSGQNMRDSQSVLSSGATVSSLPGPCVGTTDSDLDVAASQNFSSANPDVSASVKEEGTGPPDRPENDTGLERCVADDSETDDNDLYLSECRICLVGFDASDMRKLVGVIRKGGGSRYMSCSERLTHIVVGAPSDAEKRELRGLAALGIIHVVRRNWLEDCDRERKEVPVIQKHTAYELLLPRDLSNKSSTARIRSTKQGGCSTLLSSMPVDLTSGAVSSGTEISAEKDGEEKVDVNRNGSSFLGGTKRSSQNENLCAVNDVGTSQQKVQHGGRLPSGKFSNVFIGKIFCFSHSFPQDRRDEVVQWVNEGGGEVIDGAVRKDVDFFVECHGAMHQPSSSSQTTYVSTHWIRSCLEDGCLLDIGSHILYSPLTCQIPLPGFERLRFCVSQYMDKERQLLRNLCFVLGAKFVEKLTRKVTHLLCKFATGDKYEAAYRWGTPTITCEWLYECARKGGLVAPDSFPPKVPEKPESGACNVSQYPTQAELSVDNSSQFPSQTLDLGKENTQYSSKKLRLSNEEPGFNQNTRTNMGSTAVDICHNGKENGHIVPDVAAAIEDLLEQTSKIQELKSPSVTECEKSIFSSDCSILGRDRVLSAFGPSEHWLSSLGKKEDLQTGSRDQSTGVHDGFSETQTESQLVGYEEDLSGRQMIIDRVRTRSSVT